MTTAQMLATFRFKMEDPESEKWDTGSETQIYVIFTDAQMLAIDSLYDAGKFQHLREIETIESPVDLTGGSHNLPSDFFRPMWLKTASEDFIRVHENPPEKTNTGTFFLRNDMRNPYAYTFGTKLYLQGYDATADLMLFGYIVEPSDITAVVDPSLSEFGNRLTTELATYIAWGLDRQFDRQKEVAQQVALRFGVKVNGSV